MEQRIGKLNVWGYNVEADLNVRDIFHFHHTQPTNQKLHLHNNNNNNNNTRRIVELMIKSKFLFHNLMPRDFEMLTAFDYAFSAHHIVF